MSKPSGSLELLRKLGLDTLADRYVAEDAVGSSFGGSSFKGTDLLSDKPVFMKYLICPRGEHERSKFLLEREALQELAKWPGRFAPKLLLDQVFEDVDIHVLVLEWIEGETLTSYLGRAATLSIDERLETFHRIIFAASGATLQFQHRDVHPGNILLLPSADIRMGPEYEHHEVEPAVRLLDWGEALPHIFGSYDDEPDHHFVLLRQTPASVSGSFTSLPPEVFAPWRTGNGLGGSYEAWGFGLLLYTLVTGKEPIRHRGVGDYIESIRNGQLEAWIDAATEEFGSLRLPGDAILPMVLRGMLSVARETRFGLATVGRILWDVRYEMLTLCQGPELAKYLSNPNMYEPADGWRFSSTPDFDG